MAFFLRLFGKGREEEALALTGFFVSIPIFCDSGFIVLAPIAKALSESTKKSVIGLGVALASGLVITHSLVPPTPGPLGVAGIFGIDVGKFILLSLVLAVPMTSACIAYSRKILSKKFYRLVNEDGVYRTKTGWVIREKALNKKELLFARSEPLATGPGTGVVSRTAPNKDRGGTAPNAKQKSNSAATVSPGGAGVNTTLTLSEAMRRGYAMAEKYSKAAWRQGVKEGRAAVEALRFLIAQDAEEKGSRQSM